MIYATRCCGVKELHGISVYTTPTAVLLEVHKTTLSILQNQGEGKKVPWWKFFVFTQAIPSNPIPGVLYPRYGEELAAAIVANNLGTVTEVPPDVNPNTGNTVTIWVWNMNWDNFTKWYKDQKPAISGEPGKVIYEYGQPIQF